MPGASPATGPASYYLTDHLGSVREQLTQGKIATAKFEYLPYGEMRPGFQMGLPNRGFTGHQADYATGAYFAPFRYYNVTTSRWMSRDPLGFVDGPNLYGYVRGFITNARDPLGLITYADCANVFVLDPLKNARNLAAIDIIEDLTVSILVSAGVGAALAFSIPALGFSLPTSAIFGTTAAAGMAGFLWEAYDTAADLLDIAETLARTRVTTNALHPDNNVMYRKCMEHVRQSDAEELLEQLRR